MESHEIFKRYNISEIKRYSMDHNDFDRLVRDHFPKLTGNDKYKEFECVAEFEWNNYSNYDTSISQEDLFDGKTYDKYERKDIVKGNAQFNFNAFLLYMAENNLIPFGSYEVQVFW